jgi:hypothetical protein
MKTAVLFLFYKSPTNCALKLSLIRRVNPNIEVYGLFGGELDKQSFYGPVRDILDDYWAHPEKSAYWKYVNMDSMVADWYLDRGKKLNWDALFIFEWDLLMAGTIESLAGIGNDSEFILYHEQQSIESLIQKKWYWVHRQEQRSELASFQRELVKQFGIHAEVIGHEAIFYSFSRCFLEESAKLLSNMPGMIEYRLPTVAASLGYTLIQPRFPDNWAEFNRCNKKEVVASEIAEELANPNGCRCFHPVYSDFFLLNYEKYKEAFTLPL